MKTIFQKFSAAIKSSKPFKRTPSVRRVPLVSVREQLVRALNDCHDHAAQRVAYQIGVAATAQDLWLLRSDIHQCIAWTHSQAEASARIEPIAETFRGWLPEHQLSPARHPSRRATRAL